MDNSCLNGQVLPPDWVHSILRDNMFGARQLVISLSKYQAAMTPQASKHLREVKEVRDFQNMLKKEGNQAARDREFLVNGPENLPTDESEEYEPDEADFETIPSEVNLIEGSESHTKKLYSFKNIEAFKKF
jgi:hypothetical protein